MKALDRTSVGRFSGLLALTLALSVAVSSSVSFGATKVATAPAKKAQVRKASKATVSKSAQKVNSEYQTNMAFDGATLNGKLAEGSLRKIVVENDKSLEDLLGVRKKFDDRELEEKQRNASW